MMNIKVLACAGAVLTDCHWRDCAVDTEIVPVGVSLALRLRPLNPKKIVEDMQRRYAVDMLWKQVVAQLPEELLDQLPSETRAKLNEIKQQLKDGTMPFADLPKTFAATMKKAAEIEMREDVSFQRDLDGYIGKMPEAQRVKAQQILDKLRAKDQDGLGFQDMNNIVEIATVLKDDPHTSRDLREKLEKFALLLGALPQMKAISEGVLSGFRTELQDLKRRIDAQPAIQELAREVQKLMPKPDVPRIMGLGELKNRLEALENDMASKADLEALKASIKQEVRSPVKIEMWFWICVGTLSALLIAAIFAAVCVCRINKDIREIDVDIGSVFDELNNLPRSLPRHS